MLDDDELPDTVPNFIPRKDSAPIQKREVIMKNDDVEVTEEVQEEAAAPVKRRKAANNGNGKATHKVAAAKPGKAPVKAKGALKAKVKAKAPNKAPAKTRLRDPATLDSWGFLKGSIKSQAAVLYARKNGASLEEVKEKVGSVQYNMLTELEHKGFTVERLEGKSSTGRKVTRFKIIPK